MKKGLIIIAAMLLLAGCGNEATTIDDTGKDGITQAPGTNDISGGEGEAVSEGYRFETDGITIPMNVDVAPILAALGESQEYFEAESCAFHGLDKIYTYNGFEINTYPNGDKDYIASVYFLDDSVTTEEGIYLGSALDDVVAAYGEDYREESGEYTYTLGESRLSFIVEEDSVTAITYSAIVEGLE